jgi:hypothetical protein
MPYFRTDGVRSSSIKSMKSPHALEIQYIHDTYIYARTLTSMRLTKLSHVFLLSMGMSSEKNSAGHLC